MANLQDKFKQRQALEDAYSNFVEPYVNEVMEIQSNPVPISPVRVCEMGTYRVSGWLLLTLVYCWWMRQRP